MKTHSKILSAIFIISASLMACGHNNKATTSSNDTGKAGKADTTIISGNQKNIKNDSVSGDPSAKGSSDPDAHLPKK